ncbi:MAG: hypothetical protein PSX37_09825 [bacterium]|nr:hypothetical protein [bacterium]
MPNRGIGYDAMVFVGLRRHLDHRQRDEIRKSLVDQHGVSLSAGEVSDLAKCFLEYMERLHQACNEPLRKALKGDGGWPLHVDATGENGRGTTLVALAGWRKWVLGAWKIPTERADAILPRLRSVVNSFGAPVGVVRDLGPAVTGAVDNLVDECELDIPVLACHLHFLADIGKDLMDPAHGELRTWFRRFEVPSRLRALARDLGRKLGEEIDQAREALPDWGGQQDGTHRVPEGRDGLAAVRALAQWVLDYPADGSGQGFPFDRPYLDLYDRCLCMRRAVDAFLLKPPEDRLVRGSLERPGRMLDPATCQVPLAQVARRLRKRAQLFDELRDALRLIPKSGEPEVDSSSEPSPQGPQKLKEVRIDVDRLKTSLQERRPERGPGQDTRQAIDLILRHLEKHGDSLWGHAIPMPEGLGGGIRLIERTNNILESFFRSMKQGERRRSGRKNLAQDFENLPAAAALVRNLLDPDYVSIVCGSLDDLPQAFAQLDISRRRELLARSTPTAGTKTPPPDIVSASLPRADRRFVRSGAMRQRVNSAARSRAPRTDRTGREQPACPTAN